MRLTVIRQIYGRDHYLASLFEHLDAAGDVSTVTFRADVAGSSSLQGFGLDARELETVLWFPQYPRMVTLPDFDWGGFVGRRVLLDFDVCQNYSTIASENRLGTYAGHLRRHGITEVIVSSRYVRDRLCDEGFAAYWLPTATDADYFTKKPVDRTAIRHFGTRYPARRALMRTLRRAGYELEHVACPRSELADVLNSTAVGVVCDMQARTSLPTPSWAFRRLPAVLYRMEPGIEPMMKQYEYAAAGCTLVCDEQPDREFLGFVNGETCFSYRTIAESPLALRRAIASSSSDRSVAAAGRDLVRNWHTWARRAPLLWQISAGAGAPLDMEYQPK